MVRGWLTPVQADVDRLRQTASAMKEQNLAERQRAFETKAASIRVKREALHSNELGKSTAARCALAGAVAIAPNQAGFTCYDPFCRTAAASRRAG